MKYDLTISSSPHIRASHSTASIMRDVCIALAPALIFAIWIGMLIVSARIAKRKPVAAEG